jgi:hypothetical protein
MSAGCDGPPAAALGGLALLVVAVLFARSPPRGRSERSAI